jgi:PKD repeat protein
MKASAQTELSVLIDGYTTEGISVQLQDDGNIVIAAVVTYDGASDKLLVARYDSLGQPEYSFGSEGIVLLSSGCDDLHPNDMTLDSDKMYLCGYKGYFEKAVLLRLNNPSCAPIVSDYTTSISGLNVQFACELNNVSTWAWNFGDGNTNTEQNPSHTYDEEGTYEVCLTITDSCGSNTACQSITICEELNTEYIYQINDLEVHFSNLVNTADSFYWDFGDGAASEATSPDHVYASSGTYTACLYEFDECGYADTMCKELAVCAVVAADFTFSQTGNQVSFTNASSNATEFLWDFGDGNFSSEENPVYTYSQSGSFNACLTAGDVCSADTFCAAITTPTSCEAYFEIVADPDEEGLYYGYNLSSGENLTYYWTWGDGNSSTGPLPEHEYEDSGLYSICLYIVDTVNLCAHSFCADYTILKMLDGIHQIIFVDYPVNNPSTTADQIQWRVYPNPFSSSATIVFSSPKAIRLSIELFSADGKQLLTVAEGDFAEGTFHFPLQRNQLQAGLYHLRLQTDFSVHTLKLAVE